MRVAPIAVLVGALVSGACSSTLVIRKDVPEPVVVESGPPPHAHPKKHGKLGIPPGHLPPPGQCRIWIPGRPPGHQPPPGRCSSLASQVPPGAWLIHSPSRARERVEVSVYHESRPRMVVVVRLYDAKTGRFLNEHYR